MKLYIIRHGKTLWNQLNILQGGIDSPLLESSIKEILAIKSVITNNSLYFDIVCTSQSGRTINTAKFLGYNNILELEEFNELRMGEIQGKTYEEFKILHCHQYFNYFNNPEQYNPQMFHGESFISLSNRIEKGMEKLKKRFFNKNILIISHGVTIQGIISYLKNGRVIVKDFKTIPLPNNLELLEFIFS